MHARWQPRADLNRVWDAPSAAAHPEVYHVKEHLSRLVRHGHHLAAVVDVHAHSTAPGAFLYGGPRVATAPGAPHVDPAALADALAATCPVFNRAACKFTAGRHAGRLRVVAAKELGAGLSVTLEASLAGTEAAPFTADDLRGYGAAACRAIAALLR